MQNSFRWYGPHDPVSLSDIRQSNADFIVTSLHIYHMVKNGVK